MRQTALQNVVKQAVVNKFCLQAFLRILWHHRPDESSSTSPPTLSRPVQDGVLPPCSSCLGLIFFPRSILLGSRDPSEKKRWPFVPVASPKQIDQEGGRGGGGGVTMFVYEKMTINFSCELILVEKTAMFSVANNARNYAQ